VHPSVHDAPIFAIEDDFIGASMVQIPVHRAVHFAPERQYTIIFEVQLVHSLIFAIFGRYDSLWIEIPNEYMEECYTNFLKL
jgi:hypothetical protein